MLLLFAKLRRLAWLTIPVLLGLLACIPYHPKVSLTRDLAVITPGGTVERWLPANEPPVLPQKTRLEGDGFRTDVPAAWQEDTSAPAAQSALLTNGARIEVYNQDLASIGVTAETYIGYGSRSVESGWAGLKKLGYQKLAIAGTPAEVRTWTRPVLRTVQGDRNYYREVDLVFNKGRVVTLLLKATAEQFPAAQADLLAIAESLRLDKGAHPAVRSEPVSNRDLPALLPAGRGGFGIYDPRLEVGSFTQQWPDYQKWEQGLDYKFPLVMTYLHYGQDFPRAYMDQMDRDGRRVMLTVQSWNPTAREAVYAESTSDLVRLLNGEFDGYLRQWAKDAAAWHKPFLLRFDNEMNADWVTWSAFKVGKDTELYRQAWIHVWTIFHDAGATNAQWVWNPNDTSFPNWRWNDHSNYWPGAQYVDWVGLTAYNTGDTEGTNRWREFGASYGPIYDEYRAMFHKPMLITEFATHDAPGDKVAWMKRMFAELPQRFPEIRFAVWFNANESVYNGKVVRKYRLDSAPATLKAFREGVHAPYFVQAPAQP